MTNKPNKRAWTTLVLLWLGLMFLLFAGDGQANAQDAIPEVVVKGLNNPSGVAIQPNTGHVFVSDSGAGRVVRVIDGEIEDVITGFPTEGYGTNPTYKIGPLGLLFLDENTLVVGGGGLPDGDDLIRVFKVPVVGEKAIQVAEVQASEAQAVEKTGKSKSPELARLSLPSTEQMPGEGNFYGLALGTEKLFVTCNGDDNKGWVAQANVGSNRQVTKLTRLIATKEATGVDAPVAATISPQGYLVIGQMGEIKDLNDSLLTFYSQAGRKLGVYKTGLNDITGLAYGPQHNRLFALDFNWASPKQGGLYKLVDMKSETQCEAVLMSRLEKPTALAFTAKGDCYITLAGTNGNPDGELVLIRQLDIDPNP